MSTTGGIKVFTGNANPKLAEEICRHLGCDMGRAFADRFSDGEFNFQIDENVRGGDVFIVQPTSPPTDAHVMELLVMLDAFRRSSAERITAVIPYYGYGRSDKKDRPRVPISARLVANLITVAGADRLLTIDLHAAQIQGFFDIPVDHLYSAPVMIGYYQNNPLPNLTVVAPDTGGAERARAYAKRLDADLALCDNGDNNSSYRCNGGISESLGKRSRDDVARTMPGLPAQKRRTTVGVHLPGSMFSPTLPLLVPVQD